MPFFRLKNAPWINGNLASNVLSIEEAMNKILEMLDKIDREYGIAEIHAGDSGVLIRIDTIPNKLGRIQFWCKYFSNSATWAHRIVLKPDSPFWDFNIFFPEYNEVVLDLIRIYETAPAERNKFFPKIRLNKCNEEVMYSATVPMALEMAAYGGFEEFLNYLREGEAEITRRLYKEFNKDPLDRWISTTYIYFRLGDLAPYHILKLEGKGGAIYKVIQEYGAMKIFDYDEFKEIIRDSAISVVQRMIRKEKWNYRDRYSRRATDRFREFWEQLSKGVPIVEEEQEDDRQDDDNTTSDYEIQTNKKAVLQWIKWYAEFAGGDD